MRWVWGNWQGGASHALSPHVLMSSCSMFCKQWLCTVMQWLRSFVALCMCITRYRLAAGLLCTVHLHEHHRRKPWLLLLWAISEWHHVCVIWGYVVAPLWVMLWLLLWLLSQPGEMLYYGCHASQEEINVSAVPMAPWVSFQSLSSCLAYPGFQGTVRTVWTGRQLGPVSRISNTMGKAHAIIPTLQFREIK